MLSPQKHGGESAKNLKRLTHLVVDDHLVPPTMTVPDEIAPVAQNLDRSTLPQIIRNYGRVDGGMRGGDADKIHIVRRTWLDACLREQRLVATEPYVIHGVLHSKANPTSLAVKRPATVGPVVPSRGSLSPLPNRLRLQSSWHTAAAVVTSSEIAPIRHYSPPETSMQVTGPHFLADQWGHPRSFAWLPKEFWPALEIEGCSRGTLAQREAKVNAMVVRLPPVRPYSSPSTDSQTLGGGEWVDFDEAAYVLVPLPRGDYSSNAMLKEATQAFADRRSRYVVSWRFVLDCAAEEELLSPANYKIVTDGHDDQDGERAGRRPPPPPY